jgi:hypothetical protein
MISIQEGNGQHYPNLSSFIPESDTNLITSISKPVSKYKLVFEPNDHVALSTTTTGETIYNCPFCLSRVGKVDTTGKLYYNTHKRVAFCQRCHATASPESEGVTNHQEDVDNFLEARSDTYGTVTLPPSIQYDKLFGELSERSINYLNSRIPIYGQLSSSLRIREIPNIGVVVPLNIHNEDRSYILRYYDSGKKKYHISSSSEGKLLYSPTNILTQGEGIEITLVEGVFDAIAASILGYPNPVAILGCYLSKLQLGILRMCNVRKINIMLDDHTLSWDLYHKIKFNMSSLCESRPKVIYTYGNDPEEMLLYKLSQLSYNPDLADKILNNLNNLIEK